MTNNDRINALVGENAALKTEIEQLQAEVERLTRLIESHEQSTLELLENRNDIQRRAETAEAEAERLRLKCELRERSKLVKRAEAAEKRADELACTVELLIKELNHHGVYITDGVDDHSKLLAEFAKEQQIKALERFQCLVVTAGEPVSAQTVRDYIEQLRKQGEQ